MATIHEAARAGDVVALLSFLDADALVLNARDRHSRTPYPAAAFLMWCILCVRSMLTWGQQQQIIWQLFTSQVRKDTYRLCTFCWRQGLL